MKKFILILTAFCLLISIGGCSVQEESYRSDYSLKTVLSDKRQYSSLSELEGRADIVVVGTFTGEAEQKVTYENSVEIDKKIVTDVCSVNTLKIDKVLMGECDSKEISVAQRYGYIEENKQLISFSSLTPMLANDSWVLFLKKGDDGNYWVLGDNNGRYPVPDKTNTKIAQAEASNLGVYRRSDFNGKIYSEVREKYFS